MASCYESVQKSNVCFFKYYHLSTASYLFYGYNPEKKTEGSQIVLTINDKEEEKFFKCVHYTLEIGAFLYYSNDKEPKAVIAFGEFKTTGCASIVTRIEFKSYNFNYNNLLNDLVKISDGKIFFAAVSIDMKSLYIVSIHNTQDNTVLYYIERIYHINSFTYNDYSFNNTIRLTIFNNYLSFCSNGITSNKESFSSLIIFSYPNSTDFSLEITHFLLNNNETNINNLTIDITKLCLIENNIFGLVLTGFKIIQVYSNSNDVYLLSSSDNKNISKGQLLSLDDSLNLYIQKNNNVYDKFTYGIKYSCVASELSFKEYNNFTIYVQDKLNKGQSKFTQEVYYGRYTFYNFSLNNQLIDEGCNKGCELCYYLNKNKCITCELGLEFEIFADNKICFIEQTSTELISNSIESETTTKELITNIETVYTELKASQSESYISTTKKIIEEISTNKIVDTSKTEIFTDFNSQIHSDKQQCNAKEIIEGFCDGILTDEMAKEIYYYIKNNKINSNFTDDYLLIKTPSLKFQLSTQEFLNNFGNLAL
jgi:hypothetical protein